MLDYSTENDYFYYNYHVGVVKHEYCYYIQKKRISPYIFKYNNFKIEHNVIEYEKQYLIQSLLDSLKPYVQLEQEETRNGEIELTARLILSKADEKDILIHNEVEKKINLIKKQIQDNYIEELNKLQYIFKNYEFEQDFKKFSMFIWLNFFYCSIITIVLFYFYI